MSRRERERPSSEGLLRPGAARRAQQSQHRSDAGPGDALAPRSPDEAQLAVERAESEQATSVDKAGPESGSGGQPSQARRAPAAPGRGASSDQVVAAGRTSEPAVSEEELARGLDPADSDDEAVRRLLAASGRRRWRIGAFGRLYRGETSFDFVGRRRWWFGLSALIIVAGIASLGIRGFNFGIDFKGGTSWTVSRPGISQSKVLSAVEAAGLSQPTVVVLGGKTAQVEADLNNMPARQQQQISNAVVATLRRLAPGQDVSISTVGPTWGSEVTKRAVTALIVFFVAVGVYISLRFEPKMALAAFVALLHDLLVTAGVFSLAGFQVTPDAVIAVLTILGYSLYDTVVVFDRVRDNARGLGSMGRMTYSEMVNLSMNQTLARSINTSLVAILPVLAVLTVGAELLGAITLQNYGLALFVGLVSGTYSSIFIASPILALMKEREPRYRNIAKRLETRGERLGILTPAAAAELALAGTSRSLLPGGRPSNGRSVDEVAIEGSEHNGHGDSTASAGGDGSPAGDGRSAAGAARPEPLERAGTRGGQSGRGAPPRAAGQRAGSSTRSARRSTSASRSRRSRKRR